MKKTSIIFALAFLMLGAGGVVLAQPMMGQFLNASDTNSETAQEEQKGKELWQNLQSNQRSCQNLSDEDYELLGEYFMGAMAGDSHAAMNAMLKQRFGKEGEEQTHITMGKRMSGCDTSVSYPQGNFMPMMGGWSSLTGFNQSNNNSMMWGFGNNPMGLGFGWFGGISMLIFWILIITGIAVLIRWLIMGPSHCIHGQSRTPLDILKERYAKGEISKEEFDKMKKDLD